MTLRIRAYNVEFGDAILLSIPDEDASGKPLMRHLLIDVGNKHGKKGGNKVFIPVIDAIAAAIAPATNIDLYVMTHEHLDHVEGLYEYRQKKGPLPFTIDHVWMTASADPDYHLIAPDAVRTKKKKRALYHALENLAAATRLREDPRVAALLENNDPDMTDKCVAFLRTLAPGKTHYVHRETDVSKRHPFRKAKITIWAPEKDTTVYYAKKKTRFSYLEELEVETARQRKPPPPIPLPGVDATAFYNLVQRRSLALMEGLFTIDKAENDTSLVFCLEWAKRKLLFVGDAEQKSWAMMDAQNQLQKVDFLKVGHHGSHNATPKDPLLRKMLPTGGAKGDAIVSTASESGYGGVPHDETLGRIKKGAKIKSTESVDVGKWIDVVIDAG